MNLIFYLRTGFHYPKLLGGFSDFFYNAGYLTLIYLCQALFIVNKNWLDTNMCGGNVIIIAVLLLLFFFFDYQSNLCIESKVMIIFFWTKKNKWIGPKSEPWRTQTFIRIVWCSVFSAHDNSGFVVGSIQGDCVAFTRTVSANYHQLLSCSTLLPPICQYKLRYSI